jgi:RND family efflux transporter MFP subunit
MKPSSLLSTIVLIASSHAIQANEFDCLIEPTQTVEIRSPVSGLIEKIHVKRGDYVTKGMVLVTLDSTVERSATELAKFKSETVGSVRSGESRVEFAGRKYTRKKNLSDQKFVSIQERDEAETELRLAESELLLAREGKEASQIEHRHAINLLNQRVLRSPLSGVVVDQILHPGEMVSVSESSKPVLKLAQIDPLKVDVIVPVALYGQVKQGMRAEILPEAPIGGKYASSVQVVDRVIDAASGTFGVRMELNNPKNALPGGIKCRAKFADARIEPAAKNVTPAKVNSQLTGVATKPLIAKR